MLGMGLRDWWQIGHEYWLSIEPKFVAQPELERQAKQIAAKAGAGGAEQAITRFVRNEVSYLAIEFGHRAIIPKPALQTLNDRYGDCKDQSTLLCNMLRAAGIEARPALVRLRRRWR